MDGKKLLLLTFAFFVYLMLGGVIFHYLESDHESQSRENAYDFRDQILTNFSCVGQDDLERIVRRLVELRLSGVTISNQTQPTNWDFSSAFFFSGTVVTTIGYGNISPTTRGGQAFCIFYALIGIPLCGVVLAQIGSKLKVNLRPMEDRISGCLEGKRLPRWLAALLHFTIYFVTLITLFISIPAIVFMVVERWAYHEAWYYCFVTLTTIGFGDFVPGTETGRRYSWVYKWLVYVWIFFGLIIMALFISKMTDWMSDKAEHLDIRKFKPKKGGAVEEGGGDQEDAAPDSKKGMLKEENGADLGVEMTEKNGNNEVTVIE